VIVNNFPNYFSFHTVNHKDKENKETDLCKFNKIAKDVLSNSNTIIVISDTSINNNITISILYV